MITKLLRRDHFTSRKLFFVLYRMYIMCINVRMSYIIRGSRDQGISRSGDQGISGSRDQGISESGDQGIRGSEHQGIRGSRDLI